MNGILKVPPGLGSAMWVLRLPGMLPFVIKTADLLLTVLLFQSCYIRSRELVSHWLISLEDHGRLEEI